MRSTPTRHEQVDGQAPARHKPWKGYPPNKGRMLSDILGTLVGGSALHSRDQVDGWMDGWVKPIAHAPTAVYSKRCTH